MLASVTGMAADPKQHRRRLTALVGAVVLTVGLAACGSPSSTSAPSHPTTTTSTLPHTSVAAQAQFLSHLGEADSRLGTYEQTQGNLAVSALLADGTAFCALVHRKSGIDAALLGLASGAQSTEAETHLPLGVATTNTIAGISLIDLCPSDLHLLPTSVQATIAQLSQQLANPSGT